MAFLGLGKKRVRPFAERTSAFVAKLRDAAPDIVAAFEKEEFGERQQDLITSAADELGLPIGWCLCPGRNPEDLGLALSPEGSSDVRLLTGWVCSMHPRVGEIDLFPAKQAAPGNEAWTIRAHDVDVAIADLRVDARIGSGHSEIDLVVHHPAFASLPEEARVHITFLMLDELLGEDLVAQRVGSIDAVAEPAPEGSAPAADLLARVDTLLAEAGAPPRSFDGELWSTARIPDEAVQEGVFRADLRIASTAHVPIFDAWLRADTEDPLAEFGAAFAALGLSAEKFVTEDMTTQRGELEAVLDEALRGSGRVLGGGFSIERTYIDLLVTDREAAEAAVRAVVRESDLVGETAELVYLTRRDERISMI